MLYLRLFGAFQLSDAKGAAIRLPVKKDRALLAFLALSGERGCDRATLAALLWPDRGEEQARKSLRQSLVTLRKALNAEDDLLPADRRPRLALDAHGVVVDARCFEELAAQHTPAAWQEAAQLYGGTLLEDASIETLPFENWLAGMQTRFEDLACGVFMRLAEHRLTEKDWDGAATAARRAIDIDPLREMGHRLLMRALHHAGRRTEALQQFHRLSGVLRQELDVRPDPDTMALYQEIRRQAHRNEYYLLAPSTSSYAQPSTAFVDATVRPGLVVLPVRCINAGDQEEILTDGLTEELIVSLAAYRWFFVISALQAMTYKHQRVSPVQLATDLGVRYVLSGALRRVANRFQLRLTLCETRRGEHLWSERIDCFHDEVFEAQDQMAQQVAYTIEPELLRHEDQLLLRTPAHDFDAWGLVVRSRRLAELGHQDALTEARALACEAIAQAPENAFIQAGLAWVAWMTYVLVDRDRLRLVEALDAASRAVEIDPRYYLGHQVMGSCRRRVHNDYEGAIASLRRAIDTNPSYPVSYNQLISCLTTTGRPHEALSYIKPLDRISPHDPFLSFYRCVRALTYFCVGDDAAAMESARWSLAHHPIWLSSEVVFIAASQRAGMQAEAKRAMRHFKANHKGITIADVRRHMDFKHARDFLALEEQLCTAGVPTS
jgi:DNA-binding SARP family transcriptional activator/TolB-like protein